MLEHVHREQIVLAERVDRRDETGERDGEPQGEECSARRRREVCAPAAAQPQPALGEEERDEDRDADDGRRCRPRSVREHYTPRSFAMTMRCTSFVPSPISRIFWSRKSREIAYSSMKPYPPWICKDAFAARFERRPV